MAKLVALKKMIEEGDDEGKKIALPLAVKEFEEILKKEPLREKAYDGLMILYRKEKDYKSELKLINAGIKAFEKFYRSRKSGSKKIAELSRKLNKSFGFTDKKGNPLYEPEPIARWNKRRVTVEKRIK